MMLRSLLVLALCTAFQAPSPVAVVRRDVARSLFGGAPPPSEPAPPSGGKTMTIPGLGTITEEEMRLAMEFRQKMAERMAAIVVEGTALGGKVKVSYDGQGQPIKVEISDDAIKEGETAISAAVVDAAKKAQQESLVKMKQTMMSMQQEIAQQMQAQMGDKK
ncbi:hypothetical protein CTAYLR_002228 [Chrysophaeum taylorii]|uniref:Uncharacterized protein n=1 Tax=Chrysophaeum taylorii TaxID=2483200 RepID=A0AAD7UNP3_9STRA|nr:hypothetical protein CTAYLR_002228 [Chrysophaeum taylorii]